MSFNQIFKREMIDLPKYGTINCHAGKLPFYRGRNILNWALINDEKEFGITVHYMDEGIDTGDIIVQRTYPIGEEDDYGILCFSDSSSRTLSLLSYRTVTNTSSMVSSRMNFSKALCAHMPSPKYPILIIVEHDCMVGAFTHIAVGSVLCGGVSVGSRTLVGANAVVIQERRIGNHCIVGAGSVSQKSNRDKGISDSVRVIPLHCIIRAKHPVIPEPLPQHLLLIKESYDVVLPALFDAVRHTVRMAAW